MYRPGSSGQQAVHDYFDNSGLIATANTAQIMMPQRKSCTHLVLVNTSAEILMIQVGIAPAVATITNGAVTAVSVSDAGFGFHCEPEVYFYGGGNANDPQSFGATMPGWPTPNHVAKGRCIMGASALGGLQINSIEIDDPGSGYLAAPFVYLVPSRRDPTGVGLPSATVGIGLAAAGGNYYLNGTACFTTAISVWGGTQGQTYTAKWMP